MCIRDSSSGGVTAAKPTSAAPRLHDSSFISSIIQHFLRLPFRCFRDMFAADDPRQLLNAPLTGKRSYRRDRFAVSFAFFNQEMPVSYTHLLDGNTDSGVFITDFNNAKSVVSFFRVESPRWFLVNVTPYQSFNAPIRTLRQFLLLIAVLSGIICIILTYLTSKKLYFPIKSIGSKITKRCV